MAAVRRSPVSATDILTDSETCFRKVAKDENQCLIKVQKRTKIQWIRSQELLKVRENSPKYTTSSISKTWFLIYAAETKSM